MKRSVLFIAAAGMLFLSAEAKEKKPKKGKKVAVVENILTNDVDSMSYALGMNIGNDFAKNIHTIPGGKYNADLIAKGFTVSIKGDSALMALDYANDYFRQYIEAQQAKEVDLKKLDGEKFLAENMNKPGVQTTLTGLQYEIVTPAEGPKPKATDVVKVHYEGFLLDGKKFDSSLDRGEPIEFPLNQVIPGWTEGVQLMSKGAKYKFYIPYNLGYGEQGAGNVIPPFATLVFDVELIDIISE